MSRNSIFSRINDPKIRKNVIDKKLSDYATQEPQIFLEYCASQVDFKSDEDIYVDEDGDLLIAQATVELLEGYGIRVLIPEYTSPIIAVRQLEKIVLRLKNDPAHNSGLHVNFNHFDDDSSVPF